MTFGQCLLSPLLKSAVEIWAGGKISSVSLALNCIERKLICFPWQKSSRICLSRCILPLYSPKHMHVSAKLLPRQKEAVSKRQCPLFGVGKRLNQFVFSARLTLVNMKDGSLLLFCQDAPSC